MKTLQRGSDWPDGLVHGSHSESGQSRLERLSKPVARRVVERIRWLAENLEKARPQPLKGDLTGLYKLREGGYRIIYEIIREENIIIIHSIGHRREIYRRKK